MANGVPDENAGQLFLLQLGHYRRRRRAGWTLDLLERHGRQRRPMLIVPALGFRTRVKRRVLLVGWFGEEFSKAADSCACLSVRADNVHRARLHLLAFEGDLEQAEDLDRRRQRLNLVSDRRIHDALHLLLGIRKAVVVVGLHDDVGDQAVQPVLKLGAKPAHDAVDDY